MNPLENELTEALAKIRGAGTFFPSGSVPYVCPGIELKAGEKLAFPLPPFQGETIKECAEFAPFGMGELITTVSVFGLGAALPSNT